MFKREQSKLRGAAVALDLRTKPLDKRIPFLCMVQLQFTFLLVQCLKSHSVTDLTPGVIHVRLKRSEKVDDETYPRSLSFSVKLAVKWQWLGQGIEQAGDCRAVVGILREDGITPVEGYLPHPA
ncbi:hypothetical protein J6590_025004 [Homalodisca vitripennis]|nr:hypothetical protein J6590_025004 [Homalodisca vitripennis]